MIEIPEEGLRIWMCHGSTLEQPICELGIKPVVCANFKNGNCLDNMTPCDAKPYKIVPVKEDER